MSEPVLSLNNLKAGYGQTEILHDLSMYVNQDEIVAIIGPNGAGKSTAMKSVLGLLNIREGSVVLNGEDITDTPAQKVIEKGISYVPQTNNVFVNLSVQENLEMGAWTRPVGVEERLSEMFDLFPDLAEKRAQAAGSLSGGQRQMVAMAKALMVDAKILLLDEPTAGLSPKYRGEIFSTIQKIKSTGVPILIVEQNAKQALGVSDRGYVLVDGANRHTGTGEGLANDPEIARMFLGGGTDMWDAFGFEFVNFYLIPGLVLGCIYALGAIGITLTFGILRFANFAHGEIMMSGAYLTWTIMAIAGYAGLTLHPLVAMVPAAFMVILLFLGTDRYFYKPFRKEDTIKVVMASFGMMLIIRSAVQVIWGPNQITFVPGIAKPNAALQAFTGDLGMMIIMPNKHLFIFAGTIILVIALGYLLNRTRIGKAMRAVSDSPDLAHVTGIDVDKVIRATWIVGGICATAAGVFLVMDVQMLETTMGFRMLLPMFAAAILGGIGKPYGAVFGGLVIGLAEELSAYPWIGDAPLLSPGYKTGVAFAIMVIMLIVRPQGLFKGRSF